MTDQNPNETGFDFERAIADLRRAAEMLAKPEAKATFEAIQDAVKAVAAVQDTVKAVAVQDAVKAVAVQDAVKAVAVQDAVKAVASVVGDVREQIRSAITDEVAKAVALIHDAAKAAANPVKGNR